MLGVALFLCFRGDGASQDRWGECGGCGQINLNCITRCWILTYCMVTKSILFFEIMSLIVVDCR